MSRKTQTKARNLQTATQATIPTHNAIDEPDFDRKLHAFFEKLARSRFTVNRARRHFTAIPDGDFKGLPTNELASILDNLDTIIVVKSKKLRGNIAYETAIYELHQNHKLSPRLIRNILELFEVDISEQKIIKISDKVMRRGIVPSWIFRAESYIAKITGGKI